MAKDFKESKKEVLASKDMNVAEVPDSKKRYLSKLGIQQEVAKPKLTEDVKKPEVQVMKMPVVIVEEAVKKPEVNKVTEDVVKGPEVKEEVELKVETFHQPEVKKPDVKEEAKKPEVKEAVKKPEVAEAVKKPEVTEAVKKPEVKEALKKPEVKKVKVEESTEVKVAALKGRELAPTCDVITIGEEEPEVKLEASVPIGVPVVEDFLSAADVEESDVSCDEEDIGWDSETLAWAMGSEAEMRSKNVGYPQDQVGINYIAVAIDVATEKLAGCRLIQVGLSAADWLLGAVEEATTAELAPYVASVRRSGRKVRRSGEKQTGAVRPAGMLTDAALAVASTLRIGSVLHLLGWKIQPVNQPCFKKVSAADSDEETGYLFEDIDSSDYNSDLDADYLPEEESVDTEEERLEFCSDIESCITTEED